MKKLKRWAGFLALAAMLVVGNTGVSSASLIEVDFRTPGDGLLTLDTSTGLEWLDVIASENLSYNDVINGVGNDWLNGQGFRYANTDEVDLFFRHAGWDGNDQMVASSVAAANVILDLWSRSDALLNSADGTLFTRALTKTIHATDAVWTSGVTYPSEGTAQIRALFNGTTVRNKHSGLGSALIRDTINIPPVPLPAALPLFGTGLAVMGFIGWRRKRRMAAEA